MKKNRDVQITDDINGACVMCSVAGFKCSKLGSCPTVHELFKRLNEPYVPKVEFTEGEKIILKNVSDKYSWIVRDEDGELSLRCDKPSKSVKQGCWLSNGYAETFYLYNHLFQQIRWEDDEPVNFREVLKGE